MANRYGLTFGDKTGNVACARIYEEAYEEERS
jgi:hypothetical protein